MKKLILSIVLGTTMTTLGANPYSGNETFQQLIEKIKLNQASINNELIQVHTSSGAFRGKLVSMGSSYVILEMDLARTVEDLKTKKTQRIHNLQLISIAAISAIQFEVLR